MIVLSMLCVAACLSANAQSRSESTADLRQLGRQLHSDNFDVRLRTVHVLRSMGPEAVPLLIEALNDSYDAVRREAADALGARGKAASAAIPSLERLALTNPSAGTRMTAVATLGEIAAERSVNVLRSALTDRDPLVVEAAIQALARYHERAAIAAYDIARFVNSSSPGALADAAENALVQIGAPGISRWMNLVRDLGRSRPGEHSSTTEIDEDAWQRQLDFISRVTAVVEAIGPPALHPLLRVAKRNEVLTQAPAVYLLGGLGRAGEPAVPVLTHLATSSPSSNTRRQAEEALQQITR